MAKTVLFPARLPAQSERVRRVVILALGDVPGAAVVEAEDHVGKVQSLPKNRQRPLHAEAGLRIDLQVGIEVIVADWSFGPEVSGIFTSGLGGIRGRALLPLVLVNARAVVRCAKAR